MTQYVTGAAIRTLREKKHYTQKQLAKLIGKSHVTVQSYEKGTSFPNADTILKMCETYKVDPNTLLGWYVYHPRACPQPERLDPEHESLIADYDACTPERRERIALDAREKAMLSREYSKRAVPEAREA